jgi:hypothetical protein
MARSEEVSAAVALLDERDTLVVEVGNLRGQVKQLAAQLAQAQDGQRKSSEMAQRCQQERDEAVQQVAVASQKMAAMADHPDVKAGEVARARRAVAEATARLAALEKAQPQASQ